MTFTSVQSNAGGAGSGVTSAAVTLGAGITLGNLVYVLFSPGYGTTVTPPAGWSQAGPSAGYGPSGLVHLTCFYTVVTSAQAGQTSWTFTWAGAHTPAWVAREWNSSSGWAPAPLDQVQGASSTGSTTVATGTTGTTVQASELWVAGLCYDDNAVTESGLTSGWTNGAESNVAGSEALREAYQAVSATGTASCQMTISSSFDNAGIVATFMAAGGPAVAGSWPASYAVPSGFYFPFPSARPVQASITNTAGDWLFALVAWRPAPTSPGTTVTVADDAHNWWEPVGTPNTDSPAGGAVRVAVWAAPAARVTPGGTTTVQVAPTGPYLSLAALIVDVSGLQPWMQAAVITTGYANAATALALSAAAPSAQALLFSVTASDNNSDTVTGPSGWTALTTVTAGNGVDHTADITLTPAAQVTSSAPSTSVSSTGALDLAGLIAGVIVSAAAPVQPSPDWPVVITEAAIGSGAQTPPSQLTWTDISGRALALTMTQGRQYSLASLSAGQGTITLDNPDGALIPPGSGAFAGIDSGTPLRRRVIIPSLASPHYVAMSGFFRRWPWTMDTGLYRGKTIAEVTDAWGYATTPLNSMAIEECLVDEPHSLWPLTDPAGSAGGSNLAPGNSLLLAQVTSKYGTGTAAAVFGANSGALLGAASAKVTSAGQSGGGSGQWQQTLAGNSLAYNGYGYCLQCADTSFPPISGGVTVECWTAAAVASALTGVDGNGVFVATASASPAFATSGSSFPNGMPVTLSTAVGFTFPSPFVAGTVYYVVNSNGSSYDLSATQGGSAIACTVSGDGFVGAQLAWDPVIMSLRDGKGGIAGLSIRNTDGALLLLHRSGTSLAATVIDSTRDYRGAGFHYSLAITQTSWRVLTDAGSFLSASGTFSPALPASFRTLCFSGVQDATQAGYALPGTVAFAGVFPGISLQQRVVSRYWGTGFGMQAESGGDRIERVLEYAGLAGRRWLGQQTAAYETDTAVSGQDVGGQAAASSCSNIAQSALPALLYVAPTGDVTYLAKQYAYNQPVKWVLGTRPDLGEIPFTPGVATDYDPSRVVEDVQLTQLDSQAVTLPAGTMSATTMAAVAAATEAQYGGQAYQQTGYLLHDGSSGYATGAGLQDLANWLANVYARPANRIQSVTVEAAANSANSSSQLAWQFWAGVSPGDMVQVNLRVPTATVSPLVSLIARVTQTQRSSQYSQEGAKATVTCALDFAPEYNALVCDDPVRGLLNGQNVLGW